jgi:N-acetylmuramoyl-L-alanine amidase
MKVTIDAGHGGHDPGAISNGVNEKDINLILALLLREELLAYGHNVVMTRESDIYPSLTQRARTSNKNNSDLFVSIHCNAAMNEMASGFEVWTSSGDTDADDYAEAVINSFSKSFPNIKLRRDFSDGDADQERDFTVLAETTCPAILIESGFITNTDDRTRLVSPQWQRDFITTVAEAINNCCV